MQRIIPNFLDGEYLELCGSCFNEDETPNLDWSKDNMKWMEHGAVPNKHHVEYIIMLDRFKNDSNFINYFLNKVKPLFDIERYTLRAALIRSVQIGGKSQLHSDHTPALAGKEEVLSITIYLNKHWELAWGGLYVYYDLEDDNKGKFYIPEYNHANCVKSPMMHCITTIDKDAKAPRNSLQMWFRRNIDPNEPTESICPLPPPEDIQEVPAPAPEPEPIKNPVPPKVANRWINLG